ncbi:hypothetical protein [Coralloluteibacterium stylophorae]|uniref:Uncharacterized protein n=1 Tax=Coralloluteibacterium stylophorae TaxID=1776034 RepID=A0AAP2G0N8_9GAMM|nr:hypothetical protein [Coralloluteibacterium stylophorae]MBS7457696.1 hypothetical protein [Coralloluteibacterium stylophorae]
MEAPEQRSRVNLGVYASQREAAGSGGAMWALADALNGVSHIAADRAQKSNREDYDAGQLAEQEENATGALTPEASARIEASKFALRGYQEAQGLRKAEGLGRALQQRAATMEPDADFESVINEETNKLLEGAPEWQRKTLLPGIQRTVAGARDAWATQQLQELQVRQKEEIGSFLVSGIRDGSLMTPEGYQAAMAYMDEHSMIQDDERDDLFAASFGELLASGEVDPDAAVAFLSERRGDAPGLAEQPQYREGLLKAAEHGKTMRAAQAKAQAEAQRSSTMLTFDDQIERGYLDSKAVFDAERAGVLSSSDNVALHRRLDARREKLRKEAEKKAKDNFNLNAALTGDPTALALAGEGAATAVNDALKKLYTAKDTPTFARLTQRAAQNGVELRFLNNMLEAFDPKNPTSARASIEMMSDLRAQGGEAALARNLTPANYARLEQYEFLTKEMGQTPEQAYSQMAMTQPKDPIQVSAEARALLRNLDFDGPGFFSSTTTVSAGGDAEYVVPSEIKNPDVFRADLERRLPVIMQNTTLPADKALEVAIKQSSRYLRTINGYATFTKGLPEAAVPVVEETSDYIKSKLVEAGRLDDTDDLIPHELSNGRFTFFTSQGLPVTDPDTGVMVEINPRELMAARSSFNAEQVNAEAASARDERTAGLRSSAQLLGGRGGNLMLSEDLRRQASKERDAADAAKAPDLSFGQWLEGQSAPSTPQAPSRDQKAAEDFTTFIRGQ